jgi:hypothetical protein
MHEGIAWYWFAPKNAAAVSDQEFTICRVNVYINTIAFDIKG